MREFKVRVWDKKDKQMRKVDSIAFDENGDIKVVNIWEYDIIEQKDRIIHLSTEEELKRITLLQYTGIKDKHGVEVYEGDILILANDQKGYIEWHGEAFTFRHADKMMGNSYGYRYDTSVVIGDIYGNPEILN